MQDTLALVHSEPRLTREHIILSASRQFIEGDVQHWLHPPINKGVRTLCSDDFLWLPYVTSRYIKATNDTSILNEIVSFVDGRPLHAHEESYYDLPQLASLKARLYLLQTIDTMGIEKNGYPWFAVDWFRRLE